MRNQLGAFLIGVGVALLGMIIWSVLIIRDNRKPKRGKGIDW